MMHTSDLQLHGVQQSTCEGSDGSPNQRPDTSPEVASTVHRNESYARLHTPDMLTLVDLDQQAIDAIVQTVPGGARNVLEIYPLSPLQEGILFHHMLNERSSTYVLSTLFELQTHSHLHALIHALQTVIDRHHVLRTAVIWEKLPRPVQVVYRRTVLPVEELKLDVRRDPIEQLNERMYQGLDLRQAPLMRLLTAATPRGDRYYALLQRHHIVFDHQSWNLVFAEVIACMQGRERDLPTPRPYRDYVAWALAHTDTHDAASFFRNRLGDWEEPTAPFDILDVREDANQIEEARQALDPKVAQLVRRQAKRLGMTPARLFHAAWALVVARTTGRDDVVFGTVLSISQRTIEQARGTPGLFVNTLPLRLTLRDVTVKQLVEQVHRELKALSQYQQAPLTAVQQCSRTGTAPLFTAVLNYRHSAGHSVVYLKPERASAVGLSVIAQRYRTNYPITLVVDDLGEGFSLTALTDRRIDAGRIIGFTHAVTRALAEALEQESQAPAYALSILPPDEQRLIMEVFNATEAEYPEHKLIHKLFEDQVRRTPNAVAVLHDKRSLSFAELNARANELARYLRKMGVGPDHVVGICVERSVEMLVGLLAILKAGGAYLPLDPNYPVERLQYMLEDAAPPLLLTHASLKVLLPATRVEVVDLDAPLCEAAGSRENIPPSELELTGQNLLYVIYTSGSTGRPKGIAMTHESMVNLIEWHRQNLPTREGARVLQFAALSFDVAFQEIFSTLCMGGTLVLVDESVRKDPQVLARFLTSQSIQRLFVPPLMLQSLAECLVAPRFDPPMSLRDVVTAGEQLRISPEIVRLFTKLSGCRLHNHYGPTETHVVTALTLTGDPSEWPSLPPIGRPISNSEIYVLDAQRQPVPIGVTGEIFIAGAGVARGYFNNPDLTSERFLAHPFSAVSQSRLYKTGDLGKWRQDGSLEYLGRNDEQVKIRGHRVELGEIEAWLARHGQVKEAAVVAREDHMGEKRLTAYVTERDDSSLTAEDMRAHLSTALPEHMVPSAFVILECLPLTRSGKLDRRALPLPDVAAYVHRRYESPQGELEENVARIWQELLGLERVGRYDNFFDLGGHSLVATRVIAHISQMLNVSLPLSVLFDRPTIEGLSKIILQELREGLINPCREA